MSLQNDHEEHSFSELNYEEGNESTAHRKNVRRMLEERLERKRLIEECKDDFDELNGEFDWNILDK